MLVTTVFTSPLLLPLSLSWLIASTFAAPLSDASTSILLDRSSSNSEATTPVSANDRSKILRPAQFAQIAYCQSADVQSSSKLKSDGFTPIAVGGDGGDVPRFFVGHDSQSQSIVVAHQGTDPQNLLSIANDVKFLLKEMNSTLFPQAGSGPKVHDGFAEAHGRSADAVLSAVKSGLQSTGLKSVLVTGHSLGAAIATMDALMLRQNLDPSTAIKTVVFGLPRGGNQAYANLIDSTFGSGEFTYVTHGHDPVPNVPPRLLDYQHSSGEVHIPSSGEANAVACPGQENTNCQDGNSFFSTSVSDHAGPYFGGILMSNHNCPLSPS